MGKWTRRSLIAAGVVSGGIFVVGVAIRPGHRVPKLSPLVQGEEETLINAWVKIDQENNVTAIVPHAEMGQGAQSVLAQMLADEMDVPWEQVKLEQAPAHDEYANYTLGKGFLLGGRKIPGILQGTVDGTFLALSKAINLQVTGGSLSIRTTGLYGMRVAGAAAREMLMDAAASAWEVDVAEVSTDAAHVVHEPSGQRASYATFALAAGAKTPPSNPRLKTPDEYKLMGTNAPRLDVPAKTNGQANFGIDVVLPNMKYASVRQAPVFGAETRENTTDTNKVEMVRLKNAYVAIADSWWEAESHLRTLDLKWTSTNNDALDQESIYASLHEALEEENVRQNGEEQHVQGDVNVALQAPTKQLQATYQVPYLSQSPMEPLNCTAWHHDGICEIWTGSQNPLGLRGDVANALGLDEEQVIVHNQMLGGGFGRRANSDYSVITALASQHVSYPVKLIFSREEDTRQSRYRPAAVGKMHASFDDSGTLSTWVSRFTDRHDPAEASLIPYSIPNQDIRFVSVPTHVPFGVWRSVDHTQHAFYIESFIDELAVASNQDPFAFRANLLQHRPRHLHVLQLAAKKAAWDQIQGVNRGRGIAIQESFGTIVAQVFDVTVEQGQITINKVTCVADPGFAFNPDGFKAQMEGGIIFGLTAALYGDISIENGAVKQSNFHDYRMMRMNEAPLIDTHIVQSDGPIGGGGEPGTPPAAPGLVNAIYDATKVRLRQLPIDSTLLNLPA